MRCSEDLLSSSLAKSNSKSKFKQLSFFDPPVCRDDAENVEAALVTLKGVRLERLRDFGDVWLAWGIWRLLGLDELVLRPIWHHKEDRVKAHVLVCFLAYAMWKTLAGWMNRSGLGDAPRSLLDEISKIKSGDVVLPIHDTITGHSRELHLRCITEPDQDQKLLLKRLGVTLPKRLGSRFQLSKCSEDL